MLLITQSKPGRRVQSYLVASESAEKVQSLQRIRQMPRYLADSDQGTVRQATGLEVVSRDPRTFFSMHASPFLFLERAHLVSGTDGVFFNL